MTNEEFIAQNLCNDCNDKETCSVSCYWFDHMKRLAELKDEQFTKQKKALIDKAYEWLEDNAYDFLEFGNYTDDSSGVSFDIDGLTDNFREAMEESMEETK